MGAKNGPNRDPQKNIHFCLQLCRSMCGYLRHGVIKGGECAADNGDVHHIPKVSHKRARVKDETLV